MPIIVRWDNDAKTIVRWDFEGRWTWQDVYEAQAAEHALMDSVDHAKVDVIVDMRNTSIVPGGAPAHFNRLARSHPKAGITVIVGLSFTVEVMLGMYNRLQRDPAKRIVAAKSLDEARQMLAQRRSSTE